MLSINFRPAVIADAVPATEVHCRSWLAGYTGIVPDEVIAERCAAKRATAQERFANLQGVFHVGERAGEIVCFGAFSASDQADLPDYFNMEAFYVDPAHFRQGLGRQLMDLHWT
ncbi:MAG: GNAT family N-acetyltransferase [Oscillospiraceae bacterium]|nr:GNAT family N-acetyltransferase [Oscillospiraceae bacterium]